MNGKVKWGILGCANIAQNAFIPALQKASNAELWAVASRDMKKAMQWQEKYGFSNVYERYEELLDDPEVQAVYIPLPNHLHKEWTIRAAKKGKHILCEKPIALDEGQCLEMMEECRKNNVRLMEAFMYRYSDRTKKVLEVIKSGAIGEVRHVNSTFGFSYYDPNNYRMYPQYGGGSLYDVGCYPLNFAGLITGQMPVGVSANAAIIDGIDMAFSAVLEYGNDILCSIHSWFNGFDKQYSEIIGTRGLIAVPDTFRGNSGVITVVNEEGKKDIAVSESERYVLEIEDFSDAVMKGREPLLSMEESLRNMRILEQLLRQIKPLE